MDVISLSPPVVENIFKHLGARDLSSCAQVCKLWKSMSAIEFKRRTRINWFFQGCRDHNRVFSSEHDDMECGAEDFSKFEAGVCEQMKNLRIKPSFLIAFASYAFLQNFEQLFPSYVSDEPDKKKTKSDDSLYKRKYLNAVIKTALSSHLPVQTKVTFTVASGVIGCLGDYSLLEIEDGTSLSGFCLPKLPGVDIHHFSVDGQKCNLSDLVPDGTSVKCLLVFLTTRGTSIINKLIQSCLVRENCKIAVGGAIVDRTESLLGSAIAFSGENIEAASVIINPKDKKEELETKLKIFQETGLLENHCFAFMFACVARGYQYYRSYNFESATFRSLYPRVPLIGVFGNGEIGVNYIPHTPTENRIYQLGKFTRCVKKYLHSYTTVFVLVSIKV